MSTRGQLQLPQCGPLRQEQLQLLIAEVHSQARLQQPAFQRRQGQRHRKLLEEGFSEWLQPPPVNQFVPPGVLQQQQEK